MKTAEIHTIDSSYMIEFGRVSDGFRVKDLSGDTAPHTYPPPYNTYLYYYTEYGVWRRTTGNGKWEFTNDEEGKGNYRPVIIRECGILQDPETLAQKSYREMKDEEVKKTIEWYEKAKKEVKGKMYLQLIEVTIFNRKTLEVDFHENVIAENDDEAYLLAVQSFGKYDPKIHVKAAKCILGFDEIGDKVGD